MMPRPRPSSTPRGILRRYGAGNRSGPVVDDRAAREVNARYARERRRARWKKARRVVLGALGLLGLAALGMFVWLLVLIPQTPSAVALRRAADARPSRVLAANGTMLTQFEAPHHEWVPLDSIPLPLIEALLATEDRRFYEHLGLDARRTAAAAFQTLTGETQGGSTLTQQLARNLFPQEIGRHSTLTRKAKEMIAAVKIEQAHTKREILEAYLNTVPFLYNAYGVEMAARTYFGKHAPELSVVEGAMLVAMLKGPAFYNPVRHPDRALARRNLVLRLMAEGGALSPAEASRLQGQGLDVRLRPQPGQYSLAPHFTAAVRERLEEWAETWGYDLTRDGLVVWTTLDLGLQRAAEAAVAQQAERLQDVADREWGRSALPRGVEDAALRRAAETDDPAALERLRDDPEVMDSLRAAATRLEAGFVALDPYTGDVRAYVGSRDFSRDEFDHAGVARRQPGSTFKPFVYATALQMGYGPLDRVRDEAVEVDLGNGRVWRPQNAGRISGAEFTLADALAYSKNTVTVRLAQEAGPARIALTARRMGITESPLDIVPALALGTSPVTLLEMVSAYGTIANEGRRVAPRFVTRVATADGREVERFGTQARYALSGREARTLLDMLRGVVDRGTGRGIREMGVRGDVAGKTGTTQRNADGWFILMHPRLVAGAWVGFNDQRVRFRSTYWGQGGHNAILLVGDFFARVQDALGDGRFPPPPAYFDPRTSRYTALDTAATGLDPYNAAFELEPGFDDQFNPTAPGVVAVPGSAPAAPTVAPLDPSEMGVGERPRANESSGAWHRTGAPPPSAPPPGLPPDRFRTAEEMMGTDADD